MRGRLYRHLLRKSIGHQGRGVPSLLSNSSSSVRRNCLARGLPALLLKSYDDSKFNLLEFDLVEYERFLQHRVDA